MKARERATLRDVARLSGASEISVSRVMRNAPNISQSMRARVLEAADALGYTPNRLAGGLKSNLSNLVAVVVPSMGNDVFPEVLDGIDSVLRDTSYQAVLGITQYDKAREIQIIRDMLSWSPAGLIIAGIELGPAIKKMLDQHKLPVVQMMDIDGTPYQYAVGFSHKKAAEAVADFIVARRFAAPGYIGAWGERPERSKSRRQAFEARLVRHGVAIAATLIRPESSSVSLGSRATEDLLRRHPQVDCIFYANDDLAVGGVFHCMKHDIAIPDQLALIGFNGIDLAAALPIHLTTVETPRYNVGVEAAKALVTLRDTNPATTHSDLGFTLAVGDSA